LNCNYIGRHWNGSDRSRNPVICIHGWKENAASFDNLIPILIPSLNHYQFVCIDLPGHGFSSHYPAGMVYSITDSFLWILRIMKHFGWPKVSIIGHSLGGIIGFLFTSLQPNSVHQIVITFRIKFQYEFELTVSSVNLNAFFAYRLQLKD